MFNFGKDKKRTPAEQCAKLAADFRKREALAPGAAAPASLVEDTSRHLRQLGEIVGRDAAAAAPAILSAGLPAALVAHVGDLGAAERRDADDVFIAAMKSEGADAYLEANKAMVAALCADYASQAGAAAGTNAELHRGIMLRECIRHESGARAALFAANGDAQAAPPLLALFEVAAADSFDLASDALETLREALTTHRSAASTAVLESYTLFFGDFHKLLERGSYVATRQGLKLLADMLLDEEYIRVMMRYIAEPANLMRTMTLLRNDSDSIAYEAFHIFKIFVANPSKPAAIAAILAQNRDKLLAFLGRFQAKREEEDEDFAAEKALMLETIGALVVPGAAQ